jgi:hypothetical protein
MALRSCFIAVAELVGVVVDKNPVQLRGFVADGGDEAFTSPTPVLLRVGKKVAGERMAFGTLATAPVFTCGDIKLGK